MPKLTFNAGKFKFENPSPSQFGKLLKDPYWHSIAGESFTTTNLKAAARLDEWADEKTRKIFTRAFQEHYDLINLAVPPFLDPHQKEGVKWILSRKRCYLAHAPGAGKTPQAIIASCLCGGTGQVLFIVPPSLVLNWEREIRKFTAWLGIWPAIGIVQRSDNQDNTPWRADFILCPDSLLTKSYVYGRLKAMQKKFIAVDEASRFKDPLAERSIAFFGGRHNGRNYPGLFQDARHVVFLDGSPMPNRPMELWAPTYALHPEAIDCMSQDDFGYRYCGPRITERGQYTFDHASHEDELKGRLQKDFMHVVTEDALSHPERRRSLLFMNEDVRSAEHKTWERKHLGELEILDEDASRGDLARFRRELGVSKIPFITEYVSSRLRDKNESILLFAWHREVCQALHESLSAFRPGLVIGGISAQARELDFNYFQTGKKKLLILNIAAGGRGHNLQRCDRVLFGEFSWTDELNKQCEKRASRRGNDRAFTRCEYIVAPGSMDEVVLNSIFTKEKRVKRVIG